MIRACGYYCLTFLVMASPGFQSCSSSATSTSWHSNQKPNKKIEKLLIVGLTKNRENRAMVEEELSFTLAIEGDYRALASIKHLPVQKSLPTKETLLPFIDSAGIDGVLTFKLKDIKEGSKFESSSRVYSYSPDQPDFYEYLRSYRNEYVPGYTVGNSVLVIESNLYEVIEGEERGRVIFSAVSETFNPTDDQIEVAVRDFVDSLYKALKKSGYLQKVK